MSTALIMFSIFFTGAVATRKDAPASNVLSSCAFFSLIGAGVLWWLSRNG